MFYYQRMAVCLSSAYLLPFLPVITERLLSPLTIANVNEYMMLLIKMITTYGAEIGEVLDSQLSTVVLKVHELVTAGEASVTPHSEEERELGDLKRQYFLLLGTLASSSGHLVSILLSETNYGNLQLILDSIIQGCGAVGDPVSQKYAFGTLTCMTKEWLGEGNGPPSTALLPDGFADTFLSWLFHTAVLASFEVPFSLRFNLEDAKANEALTEMGQFERALHLAAGPQLEQHLLALLPSTSLRCAPDVAQQYIDGLKAASTPKQWKKFKAEFIAYHRKLNR